MEFNCLWLGEWKWEVGLGLWHPHLPPLTSLLCFWLHLTSPTATTTTSENGTSCTACFQGHVWYSADAEILLFEYFFFFLLPCLKRKSKDWQGWKGGLFLKHLPWSTWLPRAEVMCWVLRGRLLPEVSALCCMTHRVGAFRYIKDSIKITIAVLYCSPITGVCSRYRKTSLNILYQFYLVKSNLESNPIWLYSVSAMLFDLIISSLHWITSPVLFPVCALPFLPCEYDSVSRHLLLCSCCSKIQDFVSVLPSFWHSGSRCNIF